MTRVLVDELRCAVCDLPIDLGWARRSGRTTHIPCGDPEHLDQERPDGDADEPLHVRAEAAAEQAARDVVAHARASAASRPPTAPPHPHRTRTGRAPHARPARVLTALEDLATGPGPEDDLNWQTDALCAQVDPELFFPEKGGTTVPAKTVCGRCDVREQCLGYALANGERFGIWGGLSERQRRRVLTHGGDPDDLDDLDDDGADEDDDAPEPLTLLCASGGLLALAGIPLTTAQTYAAKGILPDPCGTGPRGARAWRPSVIADWLDTRRTRARQEAS